MSLDRLPATFLFGMIFKLLPDVQVAWRDVRLGAALTSLLSTLGKVGAPSFRAMNTAAHRVPMRSPL